MPTYVLRCTTESCGEMFEAYASIKEGPPAGCPDCGHDSLRAVLQPPVVLDLTPRTLGTLAERNSGAGRQYWLEEERRKAAESKVRGLEEIGRQLPAGMRPAREAVQASDHFWREGKVNKGLARLGPEQKLNYIATGDTRKAAPLA